MATGAEAPPVEVQGPVGDPFGAPDFQVTAYVNRLFPNGGCGVQFVHITCARCLLEDLLCHCPVPVAAAEASLTQLDPLIGTLKHKVSAG